MSPDFVNTGSYTESPFTHKDSLEAVELDLSKPELYRVELKQVLKSVDSVICCAGHSSKEKPFVKVG